MLLIDVLGCGPLCWQSLPYRSAVSISLAARGCGNLQNKLYRKLKFNAQFLLAKKSQIHIWLILCIFRGFLVILSTFLETLNWDLHTTWHFNGSTYCINSALLNNSNSWPRNGPKMTCYSWANWAVFFWKLMRLLSIEWIWEFRAHFLLLIFESVLGEMGIYGR